MKFNTRPGTLMEPNRQFDDLLSRYREACPVPEASPDFMPRLWARIDGRRSFPLVFQRFARILVSCSAAACLLMAALNAVPHFSNSHLAYATYTDALSAEKPVERTYYTGVRPESFPIDFRQ